MGTDAFRRHILPFTCATTAALSSVLGRQLDRVLTSQHEQFSQVCTFAIYDKGCHK